MDLSRIKQLRTLPWSILPALEAAAAIATLPEAAAAIATLPEAPAFPRPEDRTRVATFMAHAVAATGLTQRGIKTTASASSGALEVNCGVVFAFIEQGFRPKRFYAPCGLLISRQQFIQNHLFVAELSTAPSWDLAN